MKKWLPTLMIGTILLCGCNSTPPKENPPIDFPTNNKARYIKFDIPAPQYDNEINEFRNSISVKLRKDYDSFINKANGSPLEQNEKYDHFYNLVSNCIARLGDVNVPLLDPYLEAHEALDIAKTFPNDVVPNELNTLKSDLEEIVAKLEPVCKMPDDVDEFLIACAKYLRIENDLLDEHTKKIGIMTPSLLEYNKALVECSNKMLNGYDDATIIKCADNCLASLQKVRKDEKYNGYILDLHQQAYEAIKDKLSKATDKSSKSAPNAESSGTHAFNQPTSARQGENPPRDALTQPRDAAPKEDDGTVGTVVSTRSGLQYTILKQGNGPKAKDGDIVAVHYIGRLTNGTVFDSSYDRQYPLEFPLGSGYVIPGWDIGIVGMAVGEKRRLKIPPHLAYGREGSGPIPEDATLVFEVEMMKIK